LLEDDGYGTVSEPTKKGHTRQRSSTQNSRATTNSLSSRGDLILSDEEDDAVPLDDEFAVMLSRRNTNTDDQSSGRTGAGKQKLSRRSTQRTVSSKSTRSQRSSNHSTPSKRSRSQKSRNFSSPNPTSPAVEHIDPFPSMQELRREEDQLQRQEELEIEQKRQAAHRLVLERGLSHTALVSEADDKSPIDINPESMSAAVDDGRGETRSMTDVGDTDADADAETEDLAASRDTLSSQHTPAAADDSEVHENALTTGSDQNSRADPP
jgi:hypothetical protein